SVFSTASPTSETYTLSLHDALPIWAQTTVNGGVFFNFFNSESYKLTAPSSFGSSGFFGSFPVVSGAVFGRFSVAFSAEFLSVKRSEEHTSELQSRENLVCRLLLEKK